MTNLAREPLDLRYRDGRDWELRAPFTCTPRRGLTLAVPKGFVTDFASIPRVCWRVWPPTGRYGKAAVLHDYVYRTPRVPLSRAEADGLFWDAMRVLKVSVVTCVVLYAAVRVFGRWSYRPRRQ